MRSEAVWSTDTGQMDGVVPVLHGGRATPARWGARLCLACGERRALFSYRGAVKADRDHNLCFECYRAEVNRLRARRLAAAGTSMANPHPRPSKAVTDRAALLADIAIRRRHAQISARHALGETELVPVDAARASEPRRQVVLTISRDQKGRRHCSDRSSSACEVASGST